MADAFRDGILEGKVALVAGGASGINLGIAARLADKGAAVTLVSRTPERLKDAARGIEERGGKVSWAAADVRDPEAVQAAFAQTSEEFGPVDIVISGAAGNFLAPAVKLSSNGFRTVVDIDLVGTYNVFKHGYEHLRKPGASLIAISAPQAVKVMPEQVHASAAKAGVNMMTRSLAVEWGPVGVRVNAISPGYVADTEGTSRLIDTPEKVAELLATIPLGRLAQRSEIADLALFLSTDSASYITGSVYDCDGGFTLA